MDPMPRAQVAYSLWRATTQPSWNVPTCSASTPTSSCRTWGRARQQIVRWGIRYAGYPYVWGGEWGLETPGALGARRAAAQRLRLLRD